MLLSFPTLPTPPLFPAKETKIKSVITAGDQNMFSMIMNKKNMAIFLKCNFVSSNQAICL